MKHSISILNLILLSLIFQPSCTKNYDNIDGTGTKEGIYVGDIDKAISFQVADASVSANSMNITEDTSFGVFAYHHEDDWSSVTTPAVYEDMDNVSVSYSNGIWSTEQEKFWPDSGEKLSFAGYSPYMETGASYSKAKGVTFTKFNIVYTPGEDNKKDLLWSDEDESKNLVYATSSSGVPMSFHHALAKLNFVVKYNDSMLPDYQKSSFEGVKVVGIKLASLRIRGTEFTSSSNPQWTVSTSTDYTKSPTLFSGETTVTDENALVEDYFIIPQGIRDANKITITYYILPSSTEKEISLALSTDDITVWEPGKSYTYTLSISPVSSQFAIVPSVTAWSAVSSVTINANE